MVHLGLDYTRDMRIVAISDQHAYLPSKLPAGDLLIVAGDLCPDRIGGDSAREFPERQAGWLDQTYWPWVDRMGFREHVVTFGNHDWCGEVLGLTSGATVDAAVHVLGLSVWCSPWTPRFFDWAFMDTEKGLEQRYAEIPAGTDIIVSHGPPFGYGDKTFAGNHAGSMALLRAIDRVKPKLVICGHIHEGYGHYKHFGTDIYNVSLSDSMYNPANAPTVIDL